MISFISSKQAILFYLLTMILPLISACASQAAPAPTPAPEGRETAGVMGIFPHEYLGRFEELDLKEPSGIIFHAGRNSLFVMGDKGHLTELRTDGLKLRQERLDKEDTEGITYDPATGLLYVAVEGAERILEVDPETFKAVREIPVERAFEGQVLLEPSGNGIEGIAFVPDESREAGGVFYLANQTDNPNEPSLIVVVEISQSANGPVGKITDYFSLPVSDLAGLYYDQPNDRLLVISDDNNVLIHLSRSGEVLDSYALPGEHQEGITLDGQGFLYIAEDADNLVAKFKWNGDR
jgi:uncharacterized protein YjiK